MSAVHIQHIGLREGESYEVPKYSVGELGLLVKLERLVVPLLIAYQVWRMARGRGEVLFTSFDYYGDILLIKILSTVADVTIIHHRSVPDGKYYRVKAQILRWLGPKVTHLGLSVPAVQRLKDLKLRAELWEHPFTLKLDGVVAQPERQRRKYRAALISNSDYQSVPEFLSVVNSRPQFRFAVRESLLAGESALPANLDVVGSAPCISDILCSVGVLVFLTKLNHVVSGTVIDAIQCGCDVVLLESPFALEIRRRFPGQTHVITTIGHLECALDTFV